MTAAHMSAAATAEQPTTTAQLEDSPRHAILLGGVIAFVVGSMMLFDSELPGYRVSLPLVAAVAVTSAALFMLGLGAAARARRLRVSTGREAMLGAAAVALEDFIESGRVRAFSESWLARSPQPVRKGDTLRVTAVDGLVLTVQPDAGMDARGRAMQGAVAEE